MTPEHKFTLLTTFGPAAIAAIVAWLVARYTVKHGPDYQKQMNDLRSEMGRISTAQEGLLAHQKQISADEQSRREAAGWQPRMELRADLKEMTNALYVSADKLFRIERIRIKNNSGAVVRTIESDFGEMVNMAVFTIPDPVLVDLTQRDPDYLGNEKTVGKLECLLAVGPVLHQMSFEFNFRVLQHSTSHLGGVVIWRRMDGQL